MTAGTAQQRTARRVGRDMSGRIRARGWLRVESPLHVGGLDGGPADALPIALDGLGRLYVPGTTLAGVLRQWFRSVEDPDGVNDLWGYVPEPPARGRPDQDPGGPDGTETPRDDGRASRVVVADGLITTDTLLNADGLPAALLDPGRLEFRPSVGIDRITGAAAQEFLYGRAVVPAGCHIRFEMDIESRADAPGRSGPISPSAADEARMGALLAALSDREIRIGAATGRGLGAVRLLDDPLTIVVDRFDSPAGLLAVLRDDPARTRTIASLRAAASRLPRRRERLDVRIAWRPRAPVMVRSGTAGLIVHTLPLTTRVDRDHLTLVLPGSSIKGALRGHAELIERTARGPAVDRPPPEPGASVTEYSAAFRRQLDQLRAVRALFGSARDDSADRRAGALRAEECNAQVTIPGSLWKSVTGGDDRPSTGEEAARASRPRLSDEVRDRLADLGMEQADHVALDRWTGGAADGRLFSVLEPYRVDWEPIRLSIDLTRLGGERGPALALLLLTLRDLAVGRIPLGASVNQGFGDIEVTEITLTGGAWPDPVDLSRALTGPHSAELDRAWTDYLAQEAS